MTAAYADQKAAAPGQDEGPAASHSPQPQTQDIEANLLLAQFQLLNPYGRRGVLAMLAGLVRLEVGP